MSLRWSFVITRGVVCGGDVVLQTVPYPAEQWTASCGSEFHTRTVLPFSVNIPNNTKPGEHSTEVLWFFRRLHIAHSVRILNKQANIAYTSIGVMYRLLGGSHWRHNLGVWRCTSDINRFCWFCRRTRSQTRRLTLQHTPIIGTWSVCMYADTKYICICDLVSTRENASFWMLYGLTQGTSNAEEFA